MLRRFYWSATWGRWWLPLAIDATPSPSMNFVFEVILCNMVRYGHWWLAINGYIWPSMCHFLEKVLCYRFVTTINGWRINCDLTGHRWVIVLTMQHGFWLQFLGPRVHKLFPCLVRVVSDNTKCGKSVWLVLIWIRFILMAKLIERFEDP